jgi:transposase
MPRRLQVRQLSEQEREIIQQTARSRTAAVRQVERARIIQASHEGQSVAEIASGLQLKEAIVESFQAFAAMVREQRVADFDTWLKDALHSDCTALKQFAHGLEHDEAAVRRALNSDWSNGQCEGQINRLKLIKRQMYGRAKFDLLRLRVLHPT